MRLLMGIVCAALLLAAVPLALQAQENEGPGGVPLGAGTQRGIEGLNNSGEAGYVTLFAHGPTTQVVTEILGGPPGRAQTVAIHRGLDCRFLGLHPFTVLKLADLHNGRGRTTVPWPKTSCCRATTCTWSTAATSPARSRSPARIFHK